MVWIAVGIVFFAGFCTGLLAAAAFGESHLESERQRAYSLGRIEGERNAHKLVPFAPRRAA